MLNKMNIERNTDGSCNILICYSTTSDTEFSLDFLSYSNLKNNVSTIFDFVKKTSKTMRVKAVKVIINGVVITTMSLSSFMNIYGAEPAKYSMAYIQSGNPTEQISYINRTNGALNTVSPSYFNISSDGSLSINNISAELVNYVHSQNMKVIPFLSNHWDRTTGINALNNAETLSTQVANYISQYNLDGVNVDIENVSESQRQQYTDFVTKLRAKIPISKEVSVAVAANPNAWVVGWHGSYDYTNLAKNSDYLMVMTYDEHWHGSEPGPVSSISFAENSIKYALTKTTANKIVIGLPFYGRIWSSDNSFDGEGITLDRVNTILTTYKATSTYDTIQKSAKAIFTITSLDPVSTLGGKTLAPGEYTIWYENEASIQAKMSLINKYNLKGVGAWALGQEPSTIWANYSSWLNPSPTVTPPAASITIPSRTGSVKATILNVRLSPSVNSKVISTIKKNSIVTILSTNSGWHKVKLANGQTGYVSGNYISETVVTPPKTTTPVVSTKTGIVTTSILNVRSSASTSSKIMTTLKKNSTVTITATRNGWHTVKLANGQTGYVSCNYVKIK